MGLDARVYCDCLRHGQLKTPHPFPDLLYLDDDGCPHIHSDDIERQVQHDTWQWNDACMHQDCTYIHHRLGNILYIAHLRDIIHAVQRTNHASYPLMLDNVLFSGSHAGDRIATGTIALLEHEIESLTSHIHHIQDTASRDMLAHFLCQMTELVQASKKTGNPITF